MSTNNKNYYEKSDSPVAVSCNDNKIFITHFNEEIIGPFYYQFTSLEQDSNIPVIPIIISSYGGDIYTLMALRDIIKSSTKPVATIALGKAMSAGAALLAAGTKGYRFATRNTSIMIHEATFDVTGKTSDIHESANNIKKLNRILMHNLASDMGTTAKNLLNKIKSLNNSDWTLSSTEAKQWGIIDHIGVPKLMNTPSDSIIVLTKAYTRSHKK